MSIGVDELIAAILRLPRDDLARVLAALQAADPRAANAVRESAATYQIERPGEAMTLVTMPLPDDLAEQARDAGLLAGHSLQRIIRKALEEHHAAATDVAPGQERRLVEENGYLVAEAFPGEEPITTEEVKMFLLDVNALFAVLNKTLGAHRSVMKWLDTETNGHNAAVDDYLVQIASNAGCRLATLDRALATRWPERTVLIN